MLIFNVKPRIKNSFTNLIVWNTYKSIALLKAQISGTPHNEVSPNSFLSPAARSRYSLLSLLILSAKRSLFVVPKSWKRLTLGTSRSRFKVCRTPCGPGKQILCWWDTSKWCSPVSQRLAVMLEHSLTPPAQQCFLKPTGIKNVVPSTFLQVSWQHLGRTSTKSCGSALMLSLLVLANTPSFKPAMWGTQPSPSSPRKEASVQDTAWAATAHWCFSAFSKRTH